MIESFKKMFINCTNFTDRTSRKDYWLATLAFFLLVIIIGVIIGIIIGIIEGITGIEGVEEYIINLLNALIYIPCTAMDVRRLHDINKSGWWIFIAFLPVIGFIWFGVLLCKKSVIENNRFGKQI